jgi:hypothetical protein
MLAGVSFTELSVDAIFVKSTKLVEVQYSVSVIKAKFNLIVTSLCEVKLMQVSFM